MEVHIRSAVLIGETIFSEGAERLLSHTNPQLAEHGYLCCTHNIHERTVLTAMVKGIVSRD
jgi:hypothetical protein